VVVKHLDEPSWAEPDGVTDLSDRLIMWSPVERRQCVLDGGRWLGRPVQTLEQPPFEDLKSSFGRPSLQQPVMQLLGSLSPGGVQRHVQIV
jgi:hypothetical protein